MPVPQPPAVGACIAESFDPNVYQVEVQPTGQRRYPVLTVGECGHGHFGEVVAVIAAPAEVQATPQSDGLSSAGSDPDLASCYSSVAGFLGWPDDDPHHTLFEYWWPAASVNAVLLRPTARERAAGATWLACASYLTPDPSTSVGPPLPVRYQGTLRDARSTGVGRDYLGLCPNGADWYHLSSTGCAAPHRSEVFGWGQLDRDASKATLTETCARLVAQATANAGLVDGTEFEVSVQAFDDEGNSVPGTTLPATAQIECGVLAAGGRLLRGSLLAIGSGPIPWA